MHRVDGWMLLVVLLAGCSSTGHRVEQSVRVETPGCERAACTLQNDRGQWVVVAPGEVRVLSSLRPLQVACRAELGVQGHADAVASSRPATGAGGVAGGAAGGAAIAAAVGAPALSFIPALGVVAVAAGVAVGAVAGRTAESIGQPLLYPAVITVPMRCSAQSPAPVWGFTVRGLGLDEGAVDPSGALVMAVSPDGPAERAGLRIGDRILAVNAVTVADAAQLEALVRAWPSGSPLPLRVQRQDRLLDLSLQAGDGAPAGPRPGGSP